MNGATAKITPPGDQIRYGIGRRFATISTIKPEKKSVSHAAKHSHHARHRHHVRAHGMRLISSVGNSDSSKLSSSSESLSCNGACPILFAFDFDISTAGAANAIV